MRVIRDNCARTGERIIKHYSQLTLLLHFSKNYSNYLEIKFLNGEKIVKSFHCSTSVSVEKCQMISKQSLESFDEWGWKKRIERVDKQAVQEVVKS